MSESTPRIAVVGAGPAGLTCARILQRHGIPVTVYDRDPHEDARDQGGSLDLHPEDGQRALREAGLFDEFCALARFEGQEMRRLHPRTAAILQHDVPAADETRAPEVDRGQLRALLLASLAPGTVRWGHHLEAVTGPTDGPRSLTFAGGCHAVADLVIGADGAWSRVRRAVSEAVPSYTGVDLLEARFDDVDARHPEVAALVGDGSALASDRHGALWAQRNDGGHVRVYAVRRRPLDWVARAGLTPDDTDGLRGLLTRDFAGWAPELLRLVTENDGPYVDRPLHVLPAPHRWTSSPSTTLVGDAAHLVPPAGVGVNLAMLDACELALAVAREPDLAAAVAAYEATMLPRSHEVAARLDGHADFLLDDEDDEDDEDEEGTRPGAPYGR